MSKILVLLELAGQGADVAISRHSLEVVAAAQQLAPQELHLCLLGHGLHAVIQKTLGWKANRLHYLDDPRLARYQYEPLVRIAQQLIEQLHPTLVLFPHSYQCRDYAPRLACRFQRSLLSDVMKIEDHNDTWHLQRPLFQARAIATISAPQSAITFVSLQQGCWNSEDLAVADAALPAAVLPTDFLRDEWLTAVEEPVRETAKNNRLQQAKRVLSVGRGVGSAENVERLKLLATQLQAEIAASRPVCDEGWLPSSVQVGSSGQTLAPELYLAFGISGAIQHLIGMKGSRKVIAINRDKNAPIFAIADIGVVGDLMELANALLAELQLGGE